MPARCRISSQQHEPVSLPAMYGSSRGEFPHNAATAVLGSTQTSRRAHLPARPSWQHWGQ
ncbi:hypothetical protein BZL30_0220 [Mycobacterium kansasii]|uniref:Uncharacterized protein n=1 Tax=Mycobacterium kansasii TaxID=1768 RepID=A0A1V3XVR3_MYCKA|nr:hypothetical protein BZL30_0220 [Mycobacterium kansasii]